MTVDELLSRYAPTNDAEDGSVENHQCYGTIRPARERAMMLELRKKDGTILALPYSMIEQVQFSPKDEIRLLACGREIRITGRNLNSNALPKVGLFRCLGRGQHATETAATRDAA